MSCSVTLKIRAESTKWGETVAVAGSIPELSNWGAAAILPPLLAASPFPIWTTTLTLPAETVVQYKYVIVSSSQIARWEALQSSDNRTFTTPAGGQTLTVDDGIIGDPKRTSATVTPSNTPSTTPTRPQKASTTRTPESQQTSTEDEQQSLAEFTAQLDTSRRQVEHVRAAVRRIRHIPTPDALPTPPSTPDQEPQLSNDAAAALVNHTLSEATADVDLIREKLRVVRATDTKTGAVASNLLILVAVLSLGIMLLVFGVLLIDPHISNYLRRNVPLAGENIRDGAVNGWKKVTSFGGSAWAMAMCWRGNLRMKMEMAFWDSMMQAAKIIERAKMGFLLDQGAALLRVVRREYGDIRENMSKFIARVQKLRVG